MHEEDPELRDLLPERRALEFLLAHSRRAADEDADTVGAEAVREARHARAAPGRLDIRLEAAPQ
jgi:hypothetical protein